MIIGIMAEQAFEEATDLLAKKIIEEASINSIILSALFSFLFLIAVFSTVYFLLKLIVLILRRIGADELVLRMLGGKILVGTWVEIIYTDMNKTTELAYSICHTSYDAEGDFMYRGVDYNFANQSIGTFKTKATNFDNNELGQNQRKLLYAYEMTHSTTSRGYGEITFHLKKSKSYMFNGFFEGNDEHRKAFVAYLVTDRKIKLRLSSTDEKFTAVQEELGKIRTRENSPTSAD
jgi:hypothetical protein